MKLKDQIKLGVMYGLGFAFTDLSISWEGDSHMKALLLVLGIISISASMVARHSVGNDKGKE